MAKPNVNTASRDELIEAGVRADVVDEIMRRRRRKGAITLDSLGEVQGVGPATLEQLGKALDFKEPPSDDAAEAQDKPQERQGGRPADDRPGSGAQSASKAFEQAQREGTDAATLRAGTEQAADLVAATAQAGAEATDRAADTMRHTVETGVRAADQGARAGLQVVQRVAEAAEETQRKVVERSAEDTSAFGRTFLELLQEQSRENLTVMTALSGVRGLDEVIRIQGEYLRGTMERMTELNRHWLELAGKMWPTALIGEDRGGPRGAGPVARSSDRAGARR